MITIAVAAWAKLGRTDFQKDMVLLKRNTEGDTLPTFLVKNQPWKAEEIGAGFGSFLSSRLGITVRNRWFWPFVWIVLYVLFFTMIIPSLSNRFLGSPLEGRILVTITFLLSVGFFLGMPFPLGMLAIRHHHRGSIAWGMNGLFSVLGGLASIVSSLQFGFNATLLFGLSLYATACLIVPKSGQLAE